MNLKKIHINDLSEDEQKAQRVGSLEKTAKCPNGKTVKCYTTKNDWQVIYSGANIIGIRCEQVYDMCDGNSYAEGSGSGSGGDKPIVPGEGEAQAVLCPDGNIVKCTSHNNDWGPIYSCLDCVGKHITGIRCDETYIFCNGQSGSGSGGSGGGAPTVPTGKDGKL